MNPSTKTETSLTAARDALETGRLLEGEAILREALDRDPEHAETRCMAGYAAFLRSDFGAALPHLEVAVRVDPLLRDAQMLRAFVLAALGRGTEAVPGFHRVLALDPACQPARVRLCELLIETGDAGQARRVLEEGRRRGLGSEMVEALEGLLAQAGSGDSRGDAATVHVPKTRTWAHTRKLLHPRRLDIAAKALHARTLLGELPSNSRISTEDLYLRHILFRTGGAEPGDEARKGSLAEYARQFSELLVSMKDKGFDPAYPIPVSRRTGLILNGAHRVAAALALGIERVPVEYRDDVDGLAWDFEWFVDQGFAPAEIDELVRTWMELQGDGAGCVLLWPPAEDRWEAIEREVAGQFPVVARRDFEFTPWQFEELVRDVYATDWGPVVGENIEAKAVFFRDYAPRVRLLVVHAPGGVHGLAAIKKEVRERHHDVVPADRFATLHTTDSAHEARHVADIFLNPGNLEALRRRPEHGLRGPFMEWLRDYHRALGDLKLDPEDCCVVGSSTLEVLGVRDSTDIDFTVSGAVRAERFTPGVTHLNADLDVVSQDYPRAIARPAAPTDDQLLRDRALHFRFRGLRFAALEVVLERKQTQRRPKDLSDVALVGRMRLEGRLQGG